MKNKNTHLKTIFISFVLLTLSISGYATPNLNGTPLDIWFGMASADNHFKSMVISNFNITVANGLVGYTYINFPNMPTGKMNIQGSEQYFPAIKLAASGHNPISGTVTVSYTLTINNGTPQNFSYPFQMSNGRFSYDFFQDTAMGPALCGIAALPPGLTPDNAIILLCLSNNSNNSNFPNIN